MALHRKLGLEFVSNSPRKFLILMRLLVEPLRELVNVKLEVADHNFELNQREFELNASLEGLESKRTYRVLVAALNSHEQRAINQLNWLSGSPEMWSLLPEEALTEADNACIGIQALECRGVFDRATFDGPSSEIPISCIFELGGPRSSTHDHGR